MPVRCAAEIPRLVHGSRGMLPRIGRFAPVPAPFDLGPDILDAGAKRVSAAIEQHQRQDRHTPSSLANLVCVGRLSQLLSRYASSLSLAAS
ncbi:MAG TPA: hypothetical protein VKB62_01300, partial [Streptosporangiaceae bacterium]|nr:hypothetical protein [Streptosporangiaceae bacterium]